ncbi:hypothetical protein L6164_016795 [Bauhinia variegata]|uniref:Uncharacterized protein n=1 Tax=Bauhinia variegata TaxID=167791 RepID=A0ACB9N5M1_BAUVA|nr:hypothetical protein L6164_016795 [Bauhinia variegata]
MESLLKRGCIVFLIFCTIVALVLAIYCGTFTPRYLKFNVTGATLTEFDLVDKNTFVFNLTLNFTIRNPNPRIGFYYDRLMAVAYYKKKQIGNATRVPFYQGYKKTISWTPVFEGKLDLPLTGKDKKEFEEEKNNGIYSVDVNIYLRVKARFAEVKSEYYFEPGKFKCHLKVPLISYNSSGHFNTAKCKSKSFYTEHHYQILEDDN